ncbi:MAG: hypothetical protein RIQ70_1482, partial [Bacteroidota bacterium]
LEQSNNALSFQNNENQLNEDI